MKKRTWVLTVFSIAFVLFVLILYFTSKRGHESKKTEQLENRGIVSILPLPKELANEPKISAPLPSPTISRPYEEGVFFPIRINVKNATLPEVVPVFKINNNPWSKEIVGKMGRAFGFSTEPVLFSDPKTGDIYYFSVGDKTLRIVPLTHVVDFKNQGAYSEIEVVNPDKIDVEGIARKFLESRYLSITGKDFSNFILSSSRTMKIGTEEALYAPGNMLSSVFIEKVMGYQIYSGTYETGELNVVVNSKGEIYRIYIDEAPSVSVNGLVNIKNIDEISQKAFSEAVVQSLNGVEDVDIGMNIISSVEITNIQFGYLSEAGVDSLYMQPILKMTGTAKLKDGRNVEVGLYMDAKKNTQ